MPCKRTGGIVPHQQARAPKKIRGVAAATNEQVDAGPMVVVNENKWPGNEMEDTFSVKCGSVLPGLNVQHFRSAMEAGRAYKCRWSIKKHAIYQI